MAPAETHIPLTVDSSTGNDGNGARLFALAVIAGLAILVAIAVLMHQPPTAHSEESDQRSHESIERAPTSLTPLQNLTSARIRELVNEWQDDASSYSLEPATITFGDLNGGGKSDAVAVVGMSGGGTGYFESLIAVINTDGSITSTPRFDLGDRIKINSIKIENRVITVDMLTQGPNDGMCCPTERRVINLVVDATNNRPVLKLQDNDPHPSPPDGGVDPGPTSPDGGRSDISGSSSRVEESSAELQNHPAVSALLDGAGLGSAQQYSVKPSANGLSRIAGGVSAPVPIVSPEAEFSDEARQQKIQGVVLVSLIVDAKGNTQTPRVIRPLGHGLDEKAIEAVNKYKFKPAFNGETNRPVPVMITIEVNFRLY